MNNVILDFLSDLGATLPEDFEVNPEKEAFADFANDIILSKNVVPCERTTKSQAKPYDKVSTSDPGDPLPDYRVPFNGGDVVV